MRGTSTRIWTLQEYDDALIKCEAELVAAREEISFWMSEGDGSEWPPENMAWRKLFDKPNRTKDETKEMVRLATVIRWKADEQIQYERAELLEGQLVNAKDENKVLLEIMKHGEENKP